MPTQAEEQQAKEFLKRAEIKTMKKDLLALRENDALKQRDKIAKIKTLEEQLQEQKQSQEKERAQAEAEKLAREEVLERNEQQERIAEKDLKNYGSEEERQQLFLLESQRFEFEKEVEAIDKEKDPALRLQKNDLLLKIRDWQEKLNAILENDKKLEDENKFLAEKAQASTIPAERKSFEESRWDLDKKIQDIEKKRWEIEKQIEGLNAQVSQTDRESERLVVQKNELRNKILGIDKSTRSIYSGILAREEEKRRGELEEQRAQRETAAKARAERNEDIRRGQYSTMPIKKAQIKEDLDKPIKGSIGASIKEKMKETAQHEEQEREKFLKEVESWAEQGGQTEIKGKTAGATAQQGSVVERAKISTPAAPKPPVPPPPPHKR